MCINEYEKIQNQIQIIWIENNNNNINNNINNSNNKIKNIKYY